MATENLLSHVVLPVATEDDALASARALEAYDPQRVTATFVVEKGGGAPDKTPVEQSEEIANTCYRAVRTVFPDADTETIYHTDVTAGIYEAAESCASSAIAYRPRGGSRLLQFLAGDISLELITDAPVPVVALPDPETKKSI